MRTETVRQKPPAWMLADCEIPEGVRVIGDVIDLAFTRGRALVACNDRLACQRAFWAGAPEQCAPPISPQESPE